ncbi:MAG: host attachment protein [Gammaproteobacteria bacterium]|nr:host attachment protein [Gammaproteobacteria bacterium]
MSSIWIVVADSSRARIFTAENSRGEMLEIQTLAHPEARLHEGDLISDKAGRERDSGFASHDMGGQTGAKEEEEIRFASAVCQELESGRISGDFNRLCIIAAPRFLGILRKHQSSALQKMVSVEVSKNLATHTPAEIREYLPVRI